MMVGTGQATVDGPIPALSFRRAPGAPTGIEVMSLTDLRDRVGRDHLGQSRRPTFHHLVGVEAGSTIHTVDFETHPLTVGSWLWVRPHQVHRWGDLDAVEGTLVLFEHDALDGATAAMAGLDDPHAPTTWHTAGALRDVLHDASAQLERAARPGLALPADVQAAVLRHLLSVLVLDLAHAPADDAPSPATDETFIGYRRAVEDGFTRTRRVDDYARDLGWSARTLSRATMAATGRTAKQVVDGRVALEAKRLLTHTDLTAAQIGERLGFDSATNFGKFFRRSAGTTPLAFRAAQRGA